MTRSPLRPVMIALVGAALAAALGGCGRKGGLDLPPQANAQGQVAPAVSGDDPPQYLGPGTVIDQSMREVDPPAPERRKRKFILDPLLD